MAWISNYILTNVWIVIIQLCPNISVDLAHLNAVYGCILITYSNLKNGCNYLAML